MTTPIGGEMLSWSDDAPAHGDALRSLLTEPFGRTLVAGPHSAQLLDALPADRVTVLVRGEADAAELATRRGVTVLCGSLEKLAAVPAYDVVVAFDGLDRLLSAEAELRTWTETLDMLLAVLNPGGRLLLGVENLFGVHRLVALPTPPANDQWVVPDDHELNRPTGHAALLSHLTQRGLAVARDYAAYPTLSSPTVLLSREILGESSLSGVLEAAVTAAVRPTADVLADPVRLAGAAFRNGLAAELAPAWLVVADYTLSQATGHPAEATVADLDRNGGVDALPDAVLDGLSDGLSDALPDGYSDGLSDALPDAVLDGRAVRLPAADLPRGRTLEAHLLAAAQRRDLPAMRELLTAWQAGPTAGVPAAQVVVAEAGAGSPIAGAPSAAAASSAANSSSTVSTPPVASTSSAETKSSAAATSSVAGTSSAGRTLSAAAASPVAGTSSAAGSEPPAASMALSARLTALAPAGDPLKALRAFAATAIAGGYAHLWPIPPDETELTAVLAGMTGRELEPADVPPADHPTAHAVGDLLADRERLTHELAEARAKHEWYESMLLRREAELKRVRQMNALLSATVPGKAATSLVGGLRAGKRAMRSVVRRTRGG